MTTNVGAVDRTARIMIGAALICWALGWFGSQYQSVWGWIGIIPLVTGVMGWCPAYSVLGMSSCKT